MGRWPGSAPRGVQFCSSTGVARWLSPMRPRLVVVAAAVALMLYMFGQEPVAEGACANPIACENLLTGNSPTEWDLPSGTDTSIRGFTTDISVNKGGTVHFKVNTPSSAYRLDIYRMGYYQGLGARRVVTIQPSVGLPQGQPSCLTDSSTGLVDCGN